MTAKEIEVDEVVEDIDVETFVSAETKVAKAPKTYAIRRTLCWVVGAVIIALSVAAGTAWGLVYLQHQRDAEAAEALAAARGYAVTLTTTDQNAIDKNFDDVLGGATGAFKDTYSKAAATMRKMLIDNKVSTTGVVEDAAVKAVRGDEVDVLLSVKQDVTSAAAKDTQTDHVIVSMTMRKVGDRWLAADVMLAGAGGKRGK
ncbi:Mce protein [Mycobacterium sp. CBMA293]|uniref:Mce protein n=1 Tax=unclassified Mycolicibacterium TaxID=2636767 RepID=UPI0012DCB5D0|nr:MULTISPECIES: Mce protein [unclassified Mycolicibacterium]MUL46398.1 Mce protein [Mycolicibacterium sp. CBMA 360]MUL57089.1 Mce protein [Mycolicibacterium sp. CBMA 335]MUL70129.1 Mce protein [Mycolicibacterium sp. CBMA 311]MUL92177.1 Mce protein [Mycolicibacterium sp. CBMA 230]MUM11033.1 Mce protein [Mycolicibacterium sp. CBMA 293]